MIFDSNELARAVVFFDREGDIETEMNIAEFQAVLDGFVPLEQMAGKMTKACYVEFDNSYCVNRLVFFLLPINSAGAVDRLWQLPLMDLASAGTKSKDLGAGPISLVCKSQCPAKHLRDRLWDPDLSPQNSVLTKLKKAIAVNRLGVQFREPEEDTLGISATSLAKIEQDLSTRLRKEYAHEFRDHMAQLLKEQRLRIATMRSDAEQANLESKKEYERRIEEYQMLLSEKERLIGDQRDINASLKETVDGQASKITAMREYFDQKLLDSTSVNDADALKEAIEIELSARFESEAKELKEQLQMREVELLYRNELEVQLHDEVARLRDVNQKALVSTGEQLLEKLVESGISLVAFQPGSGHITIPVNHVSKYLDSPEAYAAEKCGVSVERYEAWLMHFRMPVCQHESDSGKMCGDNIEQVESPLDFQVGASDRCQTCRKKKARAHLRVAGS